MFHELEVFFLLAYFLLETAHISLCIEVLEFPYIEHVNISSGRKSAAILQRPLSSSSIGTFPSFWKLLIFFYLFQQTYLPNMHYWSYANHVPICSINYDLFGILVCSNVKPASLNFLNLGKWDRSSRPYYPERKLCSRGIRKRPKEGWIIDIDNFV